MHSGDTTKVIPPTGEGHRLFLHPHSTVQTQGDAKYSDSTRKKHNNTHAKERHTALCLHTYSKYISKYKDYNRSLDSYSVTWACVIRKREREKERTDRWPMCTRRLQKSTQELDSSEMRYMTRWVLQGRGLWHCQNHTVSTDLFQGPPERYEASDLDGRCQESGCSSET